MITPRTLGLLAVGVLIIPLQAAGEEYLFRGLLMQAIGHWLRAPVWGLLLSVPLFVFGHSYDAWGLASIGVFAAVATWLTWRTGGLEAAIAMHAVNNAVVFVMAAFGMGDLNATLTTWWSALLSSLISVCFAVIFAGWWRRIDGDSRYGRTSTPHRPSC
ncbi:lysostaphin resistance A-like protein [Micropruina sp.]|uniref:CPBP family intramembrane glutamic endopeptidase n=1 Tax=Micropruina sp. TaxID=2737536 RepID=UPI0039E2163E